MIIWSPVSLCKNEQYLQDGTSDSLILLSNVKLLTLELCN